MDALTTQFKTLGIKTLLVAAFSLFSFLSFSHAKESPSSHLDTPSSDKTSFESYLDVATMSDDELELTLAELSQNQEKLEAKHGAYHMSIAGNLINLARVYVQMDEYKQARFSIEHALKVQRISFGLHEAAHIPVVEQLLLVNRLMENWAEVDKNYEYLYWLHRRVYGDNGREVLPIIQRMVYWKVEAMNKRVAGTRTKLRKAAITAIKHAEEIVDIHLNPDGKTVFPQGLKKSLIREQNEENAGF